MHQFRVIPPKVRTAAPGDILLSPFANRSQFPFSITVVPDVDLSMPAAFHNVSSFPEKRLTTGTDIDLDITQIVNSSSFPAIAVSEAPADGFIRMDVAFSNDTMFPGFTISEAPEDGNLYATFITNVSTFGAITVSGDSGDDYGPLGEEPIGEGPSF